MKERFLFEAKEHYFVVARQLCEQVLGQHDATVATALHKLIEESS